MAPSTYYDRLVRRGSRPGKKLPETRDDVLRGRVKLIHELSSQVYGVRRVWEALQREAIAAPRSTVARLMRELGLKGKPGKVRPPRRFDPIE